MRRVIRLLLLVFATLGALGVGAMWATQYLPGFGYSEYYNYGLPFGQKHGIKVSAKWVPFRLVSLESSDGRFTVMREVTRIELPTPALLRYCLGFGYSRAITPGFFRCGGLHPVMQDGTRVEYPDRYTTQYRVFAPNWFVFAAFALFPTIAAIKRYRQWRLSHREGCCHVCGYDLTGNESGVCPECGEAIRSLNVRILLVNSSPESTTQPDS